MVGDEGAICEILEYSLQTSGYETVVVHSAEEAMELELHSFDLILLDVMMGQMSGFKMARLLKNNPQTSNVPIIFCSAMGQEESKITGLEIGADDYISKPFSVREVTARVKTVLRRCSSGPKPSDPESDLSHLITFEQLSVDSSKYKCFIGGEEVSLTKKEFEMLLLFLKHRGKVFSREEIIRHVWSGDADVFDRTIDVNVTRLRKKIGDYGKYIVTRQGYGYGFDI